MSYTLYFYVYRSRRYRSYVNGHRVYEYGVGVCLFAWSEKHHHMFLQRFWGWQHFHILFPSGVTQRRALMSDRASLSSVHQHSLAVGPGSSRHITLKSTSTAKLEAIPGLSHRRWELNNLHHVLKREK